MPIRRHDRLICGSLLGITLMGCTQATLPPPMPTDADRATRQSVYDAWKLRQDDSAWIFRWQRADGHFHMDELGEVTGQYPAVNALRMNGQLRFLALGLATLVSLNVTAMAFETQDGPPAYFSERDRMMVGGVGAALLAGTTTAWALWDDPWDEIAATYNAALRTDLNLPPE